MNGQTNLLCSSHATLPLSAKTPTPTRSTRRRRTAIPCQNPSRRRRDLMDTRKRDHAAAAAGLGMCAQPDPPRHSGGGGYTDGGFAAALVDALGLGNFARLDLPAPPDDLDLAASAVPCSDRLVVSLGGATIIASPDGLANALALPLGAAALPAAVDAAVFSSPEAIAAVRAFVHGRLLLGGGAGDLRLLPEANVAALRLVEAGRAYAVDWGWFVWALLRTDVLVGNQRRSGRYLLHLMRCRRPDLFCQIDGGFTGKRRKSLVLPQEEINMLHGNSNNGYDHQLMTTEAEDGDVLVFGGGKNTGELEKGPASGHVKDQQHTTETQDQQNGNTAPTLPSFGASVQQILAHLSAMENAAVDGERTLAHNLAEVQRMKERAKEQDIEIAYLVEDAKRTLQARATKMSQLEHDKMLMQGILDGYKNMLQKSNAAFLEYRKMTRQGSGLSSLDAVADEKSKLAGLNNEAQRLKDSRSIPDLNGGLHM